MSGSVYERGYCHECGLSFGEWELDSTNPPICPQCGVILEWMGAYPSGDGQGGDGHGRMPGPSMGSVAKSSGGCCGCCMLAAVIAAAFTVAAIIFFV